MAKYADPAILSIFYRSIRHAPIVAFMLLLMSFPAFAGANRFWFQVFVVGTPMCMFRLVGRSESFGKSRQSGAMTQGAPWGSIA